MKTESFKSFCTVNTVSGISPVRVNSNGYPFVTLLSDKFEGGATNIYFGKKSSESVSEGMSAKDAGLSKAIIVTTENKDKETRLKLSFGGDYTSVEDLWEE